MKTLQKVIYSHVKTRIWRRLTSRTETCQMVFTNLKFSHESVKIWWAGNPAKDTTLKAFVWCWTVHHRAQILCLNFIKYYPTCLHVSSQLSLLDAYFIIRKYNELNHRDRAHNTMTSVQFPHHHILIDYGIDNVGIGYCCTGTNTMHSKCIFSLLHKIVLKL
jgi:hypothetical protein